MTLAPALIVLQARMGSTRLPGKVLADVCGVTVLERCVRRLQAGGTGPVVVATTYLSADDAIEQAARALGVVVVVRGAVDDVLGRYVRAAESWDGRFLIRATADNPGVDLDACARVLQHLSTGADYVVERGLPVGTAVEGMTTAALRLAGRSTTDPYDREHVTPWLRRGAGGTSAAQPLAPAALCRGDLRLTVDTPADLEYVRAVVEEAGGDPIVPLRALIAAADRLADRREGA